MRVLFICPVPPQQYWPQGIFYNSFVPTGVAQMATVLRKAGHEVRVYVREEQLRKLRMNWRVADDHVRQAMRQFAPDVVGLSLCTPMLAEVRYLAQLAKGVSKQALVVAGGPHATALPEHSLEHCPDVDVVVVGEGEQAMAELVHRGPRPDVKGIVYRDGGSLIRTPPSPPLHNLDDLPPIDYSLLDMSYYTTPSRWMIRWMEISATNLRTSRGCTNRCAFCGGHLVSGLGVRFHSVPYVIERMRHVVEHFGVKGIHFEDDTLGADANRLLALCEAIRSADLHRRIVWDGCLRVDQATPALLGAMKAAGCVQVEYGFESGSDQMLRRLGKSSSLELNQRAVRLTREAGLRIFADIMVGLPGELGSDVAATEKFLRWARPDVVSAGQLCPLPGTAIFNQLPPQVRQNLNWGAYAYMDTRELGVNLTGMSADQRDRVTRRFLKRFVGPWVLRQVLRDTSVANQAARRGLRKTLRRFALRHPLHCARIPNG